MVTQVLESRVSGNLENRLVNSIYSDLIPEIRNSLTYEQKEFINKIDSFEAPYLQEKLMREGKFRTKKRYQEVFQEFKKYVTIIGLGKKDKMSMTSPKVDEIWHQFILFTPQYHEFCKQFLGKYLHHLPNTSYTPPKGDGRASFVKNYIDIFGKIPSIWNIKNKEKSGGDDCEKCSEEGCNVDPDPD